MQAFAIAAPILNLADIFDGKVPDIGIGKSAWPSWMTLRQRIAASMTSSGVNCFNAWVSSSISLQKEQCNFFLIQEITLK